VYSTSGDPPAATSSHDDGPSQIAVSASDLATVLGASGSATPKSRRTASTNKACVALPCTFHAVAIVASTKTTPEPSAP
jgi:hypothetical protein